jgi:Binding-protein-dependent transport system inner membrane component
MGHDGVSTTVSARLALRRPSPSFRRGALTLLLLAAVYEAVARSGYFPPALMPTLGAVAQTLFSSLRDGTMLLHTAATLYRVLVGFGLAVAVGLPLGVMMGRFRPVENFVLPLTSALMPIPSLAWAPVFILWFGLGNTVSILIVFYAALFPMVINSWSGVRSVNPIWLRAAGAMGANERALFWKGDCSRRFAVYHCRAASVVLARLDRGHWRRNAGRLRLGPWLGHFRRQGVPQHRRDACVAHRHRLHRIRYRASGVRVDRTRHYLPLGHGAPGARVEWGPSSLRAKRSNPENQAKNNE